MHPPLPRVTIPKSRPSRRRPQAPLPACTFRAFLPVVPHPRTSANPPQPKPNTRPNCGRPQSPAAILFRPPRETPPQSKSKSQAAYSPSVSILLRCLRSTFLRWKIPVPGPLRQTRPARRRRSPPVLFPFPGIAKPGPEKQMRLFPYFFPVLRSLSTHLLIVRSVIPTKPKFRRSERVVVWAFCDHSNKTPKTIPSFRTESSE